MAHSEPASTGQKSVVRDETNSVLIQCFTAIYFRKMIGINQRRAARNRLSSVDWDVSLP